jgi:hypothetical protein
MAVGLLEAVTAAIGEQLNELGGFRSTRLSVELVAGSTTAFVESTFSWPTAGRFILGGVTYAYAGKTPTSLTGLTHTVSGSPVAGAKITHPAAAEVIDLTRTFSAIDQTLQTFFVGTATGSALSTVGRNVGVDRPPGLEDDAAFREVIRALAYSPKGTMFAIELALTAFFGAGNFIVWENFPTYRNTVFIRILGGLYLSLIPTGQAYLTRQELLPLNDATKEIVVTGPVTTVQGARLADEIKTTDFRFQKPSVEIDIRYDGDAGIPVWTFAGTSEADVDHLTSDGGVLRLRDLAAGDTTGYFRTARILPESVVSFDINVRPTIIPSALATSGMQFAMQVRDSAKDLAVGFYKNGSSVDIGFISPASGMLLSGVAATLNPTIYNTVTIRKHGINDVQLLVGNSVVQELSYASFDATTVNELRFGCQSTSISGVTVLLKSASYFATTGTDFWNLRGTAGATTAADTFDTNSAAIVVGDVGKAIRTYSAPTVQNDGSWYVATRVDSDVVTVSAPLQQLALVESAFPTRVRIANNARAFKYPDDVGKKIDLSLAGTVPNPGIYTIVSIQDPADLGTALSGIDVEYSNTVIVSGASFVTETEIDWRLLPNFTAESPISWELSDAGSISGTTLTLRANPPLDIPGGYVVIMEPVYTQVLSAQLVAGPEVVNQLISGNYTYHPFYMPSNPLGPFVTFLDELTVAGVIPEVSL